MRVWQRQHHLPDWAVRDYRCSGKYQPENGECFRLSPDIAQIYAEHYVVFCHGGAGTLLACLKDLPNKRIIAVANPTLADNHQTQLLTQLQSDNLLLAFNSPQ